MIEMALTKKEHELIHAIRTMAHMVHDKPENHTFTMGLIEASYITLKVHHILLDKIMELKEEAEK